MKILMITPYVTNFSRKELSRNQSGFGYMVYDIANAIAKKENVDVICTDSRGDGFKDEGVSYLIRSFPVFLNYIFCCVPFAFVYNFLRKYKMQKGAAIRFMYYWLMTGYLANILKRGNYDIVHIHGCMFSTELWVQVCKRRQIKYVITLHGLNSFSDTVMLEPAGKQYERDFLLRVVNGEFPITVISTGMKRLIEKTYGVNDCKNITVVCNSFSFKEGETVREL